MEGYIGGWSLLLNEDFSLPFYVTPDKREWFEQNVK